MKEVASGFKVAYHEAKIDAYLRGERIFPATLELDITSSCTRSCVDCPSSRSADHQSLSLDFVEMLFATLEGRTRGLLLTGGEPTMAPTFPRVLRLARQYGFQDVAVVTNGSLLGSDQVAQALLSYASTIRVSSYDWSAESCEGLEPVLEKISNLRERIDREKSLLEIGVSALTSADRVPALDRVAGSARLAGAHWVYFHPLCTDWRSGAPRLVDQTGVLEAVESCRQHDQNGFSVHVSTQRYLRDELFFDGYHTAHFLLVVGADGVNYLGAEVKYYPGYAIANLAENWRPDFLWRPERLSAIRKVNSENYGAVASRHRGVLYNDYIENVRRGAATSPKKASFRFPHIL